MNTIRLIGTVKEKPKFSHEVLGEKFYEFVLETKRKSETSDILMCFAPELLINNIEENSRIELNGEIRTRNIDGDNGKRKLIIQVFCQSIELTNKKEDTNEVNVLGFVCKKPNFRTTSTNREIAETMIASNRERSNRADYIPIITWSRNAHRICELNVGQELNMLGRLQSRVYKKLENGLEEYKTVYELSVSSFSVIESEESE